MSIFLASHRCCWYGFLVYKMTRERPSCLASVPCREFPIRAHGVTAAPAAV